MVSIIKRMFSAEARRKHKIKSMVAFLTETEDDLDQANRVIEFDPKTDAARARQIIRRTKRRADRLEVKAKADLTGEEITEEIKEITVSINEVRELIKESTRNFYAGTSFPPDKPEISLPEAWISPRNLEKRFDAAFAVVEEESDEDTEEGEVPPSPGAQSFRSVQVSAGR